MRTESTGQGRCELGAVYTGATGFPFWDDENVIMVAVSPCECVLCPCPKGLTVVLFFLMKQLMLSCANINLDPLS